MNHDARKAIRVYLFLRLRFDEWLLIDAKDGTENFYEKYGFTPFKDANNKLLITMADIRANIGELVY